MKIAWNRLLLIAILVALVIVGSMVYNLVQANNSAACDQWPVGSMDRQMCLETQ